MADLSPDKSRQEEALKLAEEWKGRGDDAGRLSRAVIESTRSHARPITEPAFTDDLAKFWAQMPDGATDSMTAAGAKQLAQAYLDAKDDCLRLHREKMDALFGPDGFPRSAPSTTRRSTAALAWAVSIFGEGAEDGEERAMRFIEEAVELVNAVGLSASVVHAIVERIYTRHKGDRGREMGQALLTLELLAEVYGIDPSRCADVEFARIQAIPKEEWERRHAAKVESGIAK